jgi:hypothetical protein
MLLHYLLTIGYMWVCTVIVKRERKTKILPEIWAEFHVLEPLEWDKGVSGIRVFRCIYVSTYAYTYVCMYVCMYGWDGWMCSSLVTEQLDEFRWHSVLTSVRVIGRHPVNLKLGAFIWVTRKISILSKMTVMILIKCYWYMVIISLSRNRYVIPLRKQRYAH